MLRCVGATVSRSLGGGSPSGIVERLSVGHASVGRGRGRGRGRVEDEDEDVRKTKGVAVVVDAAQGKGGGMRDPLLQGRHK